MYAPEDLHSFAISRQYIANTILKQKNQEIQKLKEEIKELKIERNNLKERNFLLENVVRQYTQDGAKKQK